MQELTIKALFDLKETIASDYLCEKTYPWEILPLIGEIVRTIGAALPVEKYHHPTEDVWVAKSAKIAETATISGPCIIGEDTEVRPGAFIRGKVLVGNGCVVGNSTELKNVILFNKVQVPHYNYVGDSILGYKSHMGAGAVTSNVKQDKTNVTIRYNDTKIDTGLRKFGAMLGDYVEVGCNSVLNPGTVIGRSSNIYPLSMARGYIPAESILKTGAVLVPKQKHE